MKSCFVKYIAVLAVVAAGLFAQSDRGTVTGTVADPAGAIVPNAAVELKNTETGTAFKTVTTPK